MRLNWFLKVSGIVALCQFAAGAVLASTVAYWQFDGDGGGDRYDPSVGASATYGLTESLVGGFSQSGLAAENPITNPDTTPGFVGSPSLNSGSIFSQGGLTRYVHTNGDATAALNLAGTNQWTFEGWYQMNGAVGSGQFDVLWTTRDTSNFVGMHLVVNDTGTITLYANSDGSNFSTASWGSGLNTVGEWNHVALTYDGNQGSNGRFEFFVNGNSEGSLDLAAGVNRATLDANDQGEIRFAGRASGTVSLNGRLDEWRISDQALAPSAFLIPEPSSLLLALIGLGLCCAWRRRIAV